MKAVELKDLTGLHTLSGVEKGYAKFKTDNGMEECNFISFMLDGKKYTAVEDPSDGYRSCMRYLKVEKGVIKNVFPDTKVFVTMDGAPANNSGYDDNVASFYSMKTSRLVLQVGTANVGDYYPWFVTTYKPENLPCNQKAKTRKAQNG